MNYNFKMSADEQQAYRHRPLGEESSVQAGNVIQYNEPTIAPSVEKALGKLERYACGLLVLFWAYLVLASLGILSSLFSLNNSVKDNSAIERWCRDTA